MEEYYKNKYHEQTNDYLNLINKYKELKKNNNELRKDGIPNISFSYGTLSIDFDQYDMIKLFDEFLSTMGNCVRKEFGNKIPNALDDVSEAWYEFKLVWTQWEFTGWYEDWEHISYKITKDDEIISLKYDDWSMSEDKEREAIHIKDPEGNIFLVDMVPMDLWQQTNEVYLHNGRFGYDKKNPIKKEVPNTVLRTMFILKKIHRYYIDTKEDNTKLRRRFLQYCKYHLGEIKDGK